MLAPALLKFDFFDILWFAIDFGELLRLAGNEFYGESPLRFPYVMASLP